MSDPPNTITSIAQRLHSQSFAPTPTAADYRSLVVALQRVPTEAEARDFRAVWAFEHSAWETIVARFPAEDRAADRASPLLAYVERWCEEHEIGPHANVAPQLRGMLATALVHFAVGVCSRALAAAPEPKADAAAVPPPPTTPLREMAHDAVAPGAGAPLDDADHPLPHWLDSMRIYVNGEDLPVMGPDGRLDYQALSGAMARVSRMPLSRQHREAFDKLVVNAAAYEDHCGPAPKKGATSPTDGNVLLAYNRVSASGPVYRIALLVEMRLSGIGDTLKERRDYMESMISRGIFSLSDGGADPLLLGSHPAAAPGSAA